MCVVVLFRALRYTHTGITFMPGRCKKSKKEGCGCCCCCCCIFIELSSHVSHQDVSWWNCFQFFFFRLLCYCGNNNIAIQKTWILWVSFVLHAAKRKHMNTMSDLCVCVCVCLCLSMYEFQLKQPIKMDFSDWHKRISYFLLKQHSTYVLNILFLFPLFQCAGDDGIISPVLLWIDAKMEEILGNWNVTRVFLKQI